MWSEYLNDAPKSFRKKLQYEFHQRWWEMYLTLGLRRLGLPLSTFPQDDRPDFLLKCGNTNVWIEATAPKPGTKSDAVPQSVVNGVGDLPMRECLLRLAQALTAKRDAFSSYMARGIVAEADCRVIALSACGLNQFGTLLDFPQPVMLRMVAGAGDLAIPRSGVAEAFSMRTSATFRDSGSSVDLALFCLQAFKSVAGVLYSNYDPLNAPAAPEQSFELYLNPRGSSSVPSEIRKGMTTWSEDGSTEHDAVWVKTESLDFT